MFELTLRRVMGFNPLPVASTGNIPNPLFIVQIPFHGLADAGLECFARAPAKFALNLACIHGVTPVVSWTVFHECNQAAARRFAAPGPLIENVPDCFTISIFRFSFQPPML